MRSIRLLLLAPFLLAGDAGAVLDAAEDAVREREGIDEVPATLPIKDARAGDPRIIKIGEWEWQIARNLRDWYARDIGELNVLATPSPHRGANGKVDGWRLRLERFGLAHQAGLRNGDVVHSVNGHPLHEWPTVLRAFAALRGADRYTVVLTRRSGAHRTLRYRIR